jgi:pimeloyl-ACP methyl ester carboxylesterase
MSRIARPALLGFLALPPEVAARLTPQERVWVDKLISTLLTVSLQKDGLVNDNINHIGRQRAPLEEITAPTLVVNAVDDPFKTLAGGEYTARHIAGARFVRVESGGHLLMGGLRQIWVDSAQFLNPRP